MAITYHNFAIMNHWYVAHSLSVSFDTRLEKYLTYTHTAESLLIDWSHIREGDFLDI